MKSDDGLIEMDCYARNKETGWCGTCDAKAKKHKPGYCGKDAALENEKNRFENEKARPDEWDGWGFCSPKCQERMVTNHQVEPYLQEVLRNASSSKKCMKTSKQGQMCLYQLREITVVRKFL